MSGSFGGFLNADVAAAIGFFNLFNSGTHEIAPDLTAQQVDELPTRIEGLLRLMLITTRLSSQ